jgi:hypothetical protein
VIYPGIRKEVYGLARAPLRRRIAEQRDNKGEKT